MFFTEPWKHHILDNFFDDDTLKYCHNLIKSSSLKQNNHTVLKDKRLLSYFNKVFDENFIKNNFVNHRSFEFLEPVGEINLCTKNFTYEIHDEAPYKILSTVVYISPLHANGTVLYDKDKKLSKIITWKPNRAFTFCGVQNKTWHSYGHWDKTTRITVNFFQKYW